MTRVRVLDPTAPPPEVDDEPGPAAGPLAGRVVGVRSDTAWRSYDWVLDEWTTALRAAGAVARPWIAGNRVGDQGERTRAELDTFASGVDLAIVGLGN